MQVKELRRFVNRVGTIFAYNNYYSLITQIRNALNQIKQFKTLPNLTAAQKQQLTTNLATLQTLKVEAKAALEHIQSKLVDYLLIKDFDRLNIDNPFGDGASDLLNNIEINGEDINDDVVANFTRYYQRLHSYQQLFASFLSVLGNQAEETERDILILFFEGAANVEDLKQLSKVSSDWNQIINCFGRLTRENDTNVSIVSIEKGSLIETLALSAVIITGIVKASDKILDLILKMFEIRKKALELKLMKFDGIAKAIAILEAETTVNVSNEAKNIARQLMEDYGWTEKDATINETESAVTKALKKMIKFHNSGGKVDSKLIEPTQEQINILASLNGKNQEIKNVEDQLALLENGKQILQLEEGDINDDE